MRICVIGAGMVGLHLGQCLGLAGHEVRFYDNNPAKMYSLGIEGYRKIELDNYTNGLVDIKTDTIFLAVPTPTINGKQDLSYIKNAVTMVSKIKNTANPKYLIVKSTVLPGTMRKVVAPIMKNKGYTLISNPEFLTESDPINTILNGQIIIGCKDPKEDHGLEILRAELYTHPPFKWEAHYMSWEQAELLKYASNFLLASRISAWNQIKLIADKIKVSSKDIAFILSERPTIGKYGIYHGKAYGGHCLPKDTEALLSLAEDLNVTDDLLYSTIALNNHMKDKYGENNEKYVW
jgi:UDPglucose 6-dehydrogenase